MSTEHTENSADTALHFIPEMPDVPEKLDIPAPLVTDLFMRRLYSEGQSSLLSLSQSLKLPFPLLLNVFHRLRKQQLFDVTGMVGKDYNFSITGAGSDLAEKRFAISQYTGPAPVSVQSYRTATTAQTPKVALNRTRLREALSDLVLTESFLDELGRSLIAQTSLFLYGPTGNGKSSVAWRLPRVFDDAILIPYAVEVDGQIIIVYDPAVHEKIDADNDTILDKRWILCRRPLVMVGGELEPHMLELQWDETSKVYAAPLQMKANNGILVIDDFGRQIVSPRYLLNRLIVPLDRRVDYLTLRYGVKFQIPFEMMVVFATNLNPDDLADEAFLRRIQNKVYVGNIEPQLFDEIFRRVLAKMNLPCEPGTPEYLRELCLTRGPGHLRACHPHDILHIVASINAYENLPMEVTKTNLELATRTYFTRPTQFKDQ